LYLVLSGSLSDLLATSLAGLLAGFSAADFMPILGSSLLAGWFAVLLKGMM
jgi:hypothetical protein